LSGSGPAVRILQGLTPRIRPPAFPVVRAQDDAPPPNAPHDFAITCLAGDVESPETFLPRLRVEMEHRPNAGVNGLAKDCEMRMETGVQSQPRLDEAKNHLAATVNSRFPALSVAKARFKSGRRLQFY
jgi:hypothetical protein